MTDDPASGGPVGDDGSSREPSSPDAFADAMAHLQTAALSIVAAARAALDAFEQLARDPAPLLSMVADAARAGGSSPSGPAAPPGSSPIERITVTPPPGPDAPDSSGMSDAVPNREPSDKDGAGTDDDDRYGS